MSGIISTILGGLKRAGDRNGDGTNDYGEEMRRRRAELLGEAGKKREQYRADLDKAREDIKQRMADLVMRRAESEHGADPVRPPAMSPFGNPNGVMAIMSPKLNPAYDKTKPLGQRGNMYEPTTGVKGYFQRLIGNNANALNYAQQQAEQNYLMRIGEQNNQANNAMENAALAGDTGLFANEYLNKMSEDRADVRSTMSQESQYAISDREQRARAREAAERRQFELTQNAAQWELSKPSRELNMDLAREQLRALRRETGGLRQIGQDTQELPNGEVFRRTPQYDAFGRPVGESWNLWNIGPTRTSNVHLPNESAYPEAFDQGGARDAVRTPQSQAQGRPSILKQLRDSSSTSILDDIKDTAKAGGRFLDTGRYLMGGEPVNEFVPTRAQAWMRAILNAGREY